MQNQELIEEVNEMRRRALKCEIDALSRSEKCFRKCPSGPTECITAFVITSCTNRDYF
jgi:hypothetical protein